MVTELAKRLAGTSNTQTSLKRSTVTKSNIQNKFQIGQGSVNLVDLPEIQETNVIYSGGNDSFVLGHASNGVLGVANGVGGNQIVLGDYSTSYTVNEIINPNNIWRWMLSSIENSYWVDTVNTTATVTAGSDIDFNVGEILQTNKLSTEATNIDKATLIIESGNITSSGNLTFALSADNGANFETVTLGTEHTFTNKGTNLKLKITASGNANIALKNSRGTRTPIEIQYTLNPYFFDLRVT
jgi:hypothetical protein